MTGLSTAGLARMAATPLPCLQLGEVVPNHKVEFLAEWHGNRHIGEEGPDVGAGLFFLLRTTGLVVFVLHLPHLPQNQDSTAA